MLKLVTIIAVATLFAGCAGGLVSGSAVRLQSNTDDRLFRDLLTGPGGVGFADETLYPDAKKRVLSKVQVLTPYDGSTKGQERWTVSHGDGGVSYLVDLEPDGRGGTDFKVRPESPPPASAARTNEKARRHGEQIVQPPPPLQGDDWKTRVEQDGSTKTFFWIRTGGDERLITMLHANRSIPASLRRSYEKARAERGCSGMRSEGLDSSPVNTFEREMWTIHCTEGTPLVSLHLVIAGERTTYDVVYAWRSLPSPEEVDRIAKYFRTIVVCDDSPGSRAPCPAESEKLPEM